MGTPLFSLAQEPGRKLVFSNDCEPGRHFRLGLNPALRRAPPAIATHDQQKFAISNIGLGGQKNIRQLFVIRAVHALMLGFNEDTPVANYKSEFNFGTMAEYAFVLGIQNGDAGILTLIENGFTVFGGGDNFEPGAFELNLYSIFEIAT